MHAYIKIGCKVSVLNYTNKLFYNSYHNLDEKLFITQCQVKYKTLGNSTKDKGMQ